MKTVKDREEAVKLREDLQKFYEKEDERKSQNEKFQVSVGTCYQDAVERINNIHRTNEKFSR